MVGQGGGQIFHGGLRQVGKNHEFLSSIKWQQKWCVPFHAIYTWGFFRFTAQRLYLMFPYFSSSSINLGWGPSTASYLALDLLQHRLHFLNKIQVYNLKK